MSDAPVLKMNIRLFFATVSLAALSACSTPTQLGLDAKVRELCAKDGGLHVFETVTLPPDKFNEYGQINFFQPTKRVEALGSAYEFHRAVAPLRKGDDYGSSPTLERWETSVIRRVDGKILGRVIFYRRWGGGALSGFIHPPSDSFTCPKLYGDYELFGRIFIRGQE